MIEAKHLSSENRRQYTITGIVQGVGFRPFIYQLAQELNLSGWVRNTPSGVEIEVQGVIDQFNFFEDALKNKLPPLAVVTSQTTADITPIEGDTSFTILPSGDGICDIQIAPDSSICSDCLQELFDPANRRYLYPFITCTNCGPRYSIITGIPYDRPKTTMALFPLCPDCQKEYENPLDRRFHAQPIACHACGPQLTLINSAGDKIASQDNALKEALELLKSGAILAIKGIGGYHLAVDATNHEAVRKLRERKNRDEKPFAVMVNSLETAIKLTFISEVEERLLNSPEAPIVILKKMDVTKLSPLIAPNNGWLGLMLPYTPLHHLLFAPHPSSVITQKPFSALVMTSGNISDEPVVFEDDEALKRLSKIADFFLLHDRPIHIRSDDSVIRVFQGRPLFYRRARGYAPRAITLPFEVKPLLATGAELKSALCIASGNKAFLSQHIGDLQNQSTLDSFTHTVSHISEILQIKPEVVACDLHPDYLSTRFSEDLALPLIRVQHHHAHLAACMAENNLVGEVIGIIFDGTGYGSDGTIWGGEFLVGGYDDFKRVGHFQALPQPGGDAAVREPWRMAMAYLYDAVGEEAFTLDHPLTRHLSKMEMELFAQMLRRRINSPLTSSCGRLFDAVAAMLGLRYFVSYEGQAAIELEALAEDENKDRNKDTTYTYNILSHPDTPLKLDFSPMFSELLADLQLDITTASIAYRFHQTVAAASTKLCLQIAQSSGLNRVILSGGVFQNRLLAEMLYNNLANIDFKVFTHHLTPPNDGSIALGQAAVAGWKIMKRG